MLKLQRMKWKGHQAELSTIIRFTGQCLLGTLFRKIKFNDDFGKQKKARKTECHSTTSFLLQVETDADAPTVGQSCMEACTHFNLHFNKQNKMIKLAYSGSSMRYLGVGKKQLRSIIKYFLNSLWVPLSTDNRVMNTLQSQGSRIRESGGCKSNTLTCV